MVMMQLVVQVRPKAQNKNKKFAPYSRVLMDANICPGQAATPGVSWSKLQLQETPEVPNVLQALLALPELRSTWEHKHFFLVYPSESTRV